MHAGRGGGQNFFACGKGGAEKIDDRRSWIDGPPSPYKMRPPLKDTTMHAMCQNCPRKLYPPVNSRVACHNHFCAPQVGMHPNSDHIRNLAPQDGILACPAWTDRTYRRYGLTWWMLIVIFHFLNYVSTNVLECIECGEDCTDTIEIMQAGGSDPWEIAFALGTCISGCAAQYNCM